MTTIPPRHILHARHQISKARQLLAEKDQEDNQYYMDRKQVRRAGKMAWKGVLIALNGKFNIHSSKGTNLDFRECRQFIEQHGAAQLQAFEAAYDLLFKTMGWDGTLSVVVGEEGLSYAEKIIHWCEI